MDCRFLLRVAGPATAAFALILTAACAADVTPTWHDEGAVRWREVVVRRGSPGFTAMSGDRTGIRFTNRVSDSLLLGNRILGQGAGVALGDVDGDGLPDVFLARTEGCSALFRNLGDWKFEEVTAAAGVGACDRHSSGAAFADVDGDNDLDLLLLATTGPNAIFVNDGSGRFTERRDLGLDSTGRGGTTIAMADVDGSDRLALFVANYKPYFVDDSIPPQGRSFNQLAREVAPRQFEIVPARQRDYKIVLRPDMGGLRMTQRAEPDELYLPTGDGRFRRVALTDGRFRDAANRPLRAPSESFTLGARFADLNGDGAPDLYVANDFEDTDELWFNDGRGTFRLADWFAQRQISNSTMGIDVGDVNGDGLPDLFAVDMLANDSRRLRTQIPTNTAFPKKPGEWTMQLQHQRNTLFINRGDGTFAEVGQAAGVHASGWSWGTLITDVDLDGWPDLLVANGHLWDIMDADVQESLQNRLNAVDWQRIRWEFPRLALRNVAFRNRGDLTFEDVSNRWRFGTEADVSHAMAAADLDGDGDLDIIVNRLDSPALVLRNDAPAPRVAVRLIGAAPNTRAVGATVRVTARGLPSQQREIAVGGLYMSHSDYLASFAMGQADSATIVVDWRDGTSTTLTGVRPNRLYEVRADGARPRPPVDARPAAPLFEDVSAMLGGHAHTEQWFDDWGRQFLLPSAISTLGPGLAWFDADRDGAEDLLVGASAGGRVAMFRNQNGRLTPGGAPFPIAQMSLTGLVGWAEGSASRLLAGQSTWQARSEAEMQGAPAVVQLRLARGQGVGDAAPAVGSHAAATGPLAMADYDGDGRLDLFVGSRAIPMQYPLPPSSGLFRNVDGAFTFDITNAAVLNSVGMVSAAVFADVTGDGHVDLLFAREWDSILLLINDGRGRFAVAPASWGLSRWTSRWNGIATGDLDGDGRLDVIATSWGRNTALPADSANPLVMVHGPIGARGEQEMLLARRDPRVGGLAPLTSYARARVAIPGLLNTVRTFAEWADAPVDRALGPLASRTSRMTAITMDHMVFMNRGDRFEATALPAEAQLAPAFHVGVADLDGDGDDDVYLSQNFSHTAIGRPRDDAGRGLVLLNDGTGRLTPMSGQASGVVVYGDQRGAGHADFDGDGRIDVAVTQHGGTTRLFKNRGAAPGLRVRLRGDSLNPDGIGAQVRVFFGARAGPVREVQAGSGYWSQNGAVQVFGVPTPPTRVQVRWPGGRVSEVDVPAGARAVEVSRGSR